VKQTLFAILEPVIRGRAFLDLYAGSGAAGIEALSRGASKAVFVERDRKAAATIERNLQSTGLWSDRTELAIRSVGAWIAASGTTGDARDMRDERAGFAAILVDPPYDRPELVGATLASIAAAGPGGLLARDGILVAKHFSKAGIPAEIPAESGLLGSVRERRFGETTLTFYRWADEEDA
jgi:16S rRNA (guanine(966)-N(2))-methyltransferase RsmD